MRPDVSVESFGGFPIGAVEVEALCAAFERANTLLLPEAIGFVAEAAIDHPEAPGNIVGLGIGEKMTKNKPTGKAALKFLVRKKVARDALPEGRLIPETADGCLTDVEETGEITPMQFRSRHRPAPGGVSISNCSQNAAGTLGVYVNYGKRICILSNNHVLAMSNASPSDAPIAQPGRLDGGRCPADAMARLTKFIPINFTGGANVVDAAIAVLDDPDDGDRKVLRSSDDSDVVMRPTITPTLNLAVQKSGRTTGWTKGRVDLIGTSVNVNYGTSGIARFDNQFRVLGTGGDFSRAGDSGSLVTTDPDNGPVGLCSQVAAAIPSVISLTTF